LNGAMQKEIDISFTREILASEGGSRAAYTAMTPQTHERDQA